LIKLIPSGISTKNFYDHKEVGHFLQGKSQLSALKIEKKLKSQLKVNLQSINGNIGNFSSE